MPEGQAVEAVPARVVEVYDQMMRRVIGPSLRQLGFRGTIREFKYGSRSQFGVVRWQKDGRGARAQRLRFTGNVGYWCGADRIGFLMPVPAHDTWWEIRGGQPYDSVAESVITAVRRYALPAIQAGLEDPQRPDADMQWAGGTLADPDDVGADASSFFVQPTGTSYDPHHRGGFRACIGQCLHQAVADPAGRSGHQDHRALLRSSRWPGMDGLRE